MFPDFDHLLMLEASEEFNRLVLEFIADVEKQIAGREQWSANKPD